MEDSSLWDDTVKLLHSHEETLFSACVFVDDIYADIFGWNHLIPDLIADFGVLTVAPLQGLSQEQFFSMCHLEQNHLAKACFFVTQPLEQLGRIIREAITRFFLEQVYIFTPITEEMKLEYDTSQHETAVTFQEFQEQVEEWITQSQLHKQGLVKNSRPNSKLVRILHFPLFHKPITETLFTLPVCDIFPLPGDPNLCSRTDLSVEKVAPSSQAQLHLLAYALDTTLARYNMQNYSTYSVGVTSALVGNLLKHRQEEKHSHSSQHHLSRSMGSDDDPKHVAVVLVDRTLDVVAPLCHSNNLLDRATITGLDHECEDKRNYLYHGRSEAAMELLEILWTKKYKEGILYMRNECISRIIVEIDCSSLQQEINRLNMLWNEGFFDAFFELFDRNMDKTEVYSVYNEHSEFIELVRNCNMAIKTTKTSYQEQLSFENVLMWHTLNTTNSSLTPLLQALHDKKSKTGSALYSADSIIQKAILLYSLFGVDENIDDTLHTETVHEIAALLTNTIKLCSMMQQQEIESRNTKEVPSHNFLPPNVSVADLSSEDIQKHVHTALDTAMMVQNQRYIHRLRALKHLLTEETAQTECAVLGKITPYTPLLKRLCQCIVQEGKTNEPILKDDCIRHKPTSKTEKIMQHTKQAAAAATTAGGGWFGGGLSRVAGMAGNIGGMVGDMFHHKDRICEVHKVLVFVIGGITHAEAGDIVEELKASNIEQVYVGSTSISTPTQTMQHILKM